MAVGPIIPGIGASRDIAGKVGHYASQIPMSIALRMWTILKRSDATNRLVVRTGRM